MVHSNPINDLIDISKYTDFSMDTHINVLGQVVTEIGSFKNVKIFEGKSQRLVSLDLYNSPSRSDHGKLKELLYI